MKKLTEEQISLLKQLVDHYDKEDRSVRERQIRTWRKLKLLWEGFSNIWYSEVAHDWRIFDQEQADDSDQSYYDKQINVFRAYLESIIAALSVTVPPIKCYPDDADNSLDILTARAGDRISKLIDRHNDASLLWLHGLFIYCTEGLVACYTYPREDKEYGTYKKDNYELVDEEEQFEACAICGGEVNPALMEGIEDEFSPDDNDAKLQNLVQEGKSLCPVCLDYVDTTSGTRKFKVSRLVGTTDEAKSRICMEVYGGLYVKVANYARKQADTPYLMFCYESDYTNARKMYPDIRDKIGPGSGSGNEQYERWGRTNPQYYGETPTDNVTVRNCWFRPSAFEMFSEGERDSLKNLFPNGVKVVIVNEEFAEAENEALDDCWTLTQNPLSDHLYHDPLGMVLTSIQEITNDIVSLTLQTIEHGIPQTFADPRVLNFDTYRQMETTPGAIYPATPTSGKGVNDGFYEAKVATLSGEILPFANKIQEYGQLVSGALPSLFGGQMSGSKTASEYSMSRAQALQRLQNQWKVFTTWWKSIHGKAIPAYIKCVQEDERFVEKDSSGQFVNVFIRKAELEGKIGKIELEANENLPITWSQQKDTYMQLLQSSNPIIQQMLTLPENIPLLYQAIGLDGLHIQGEADVLKQYDEIKQLLNSEPIPQPPDEMAMIEADVNGTQPTELELPSVEVDPILDNHQIEFEVVRNWLISEAGRLAKIENPAGYKNILLHAVQHQQILMQQQAQMVAEQGAAPLEKPKSDTKAPIKEESDVSVE